MNLCWFNENLQLLKSEDLSLHFEQCVLRSVGIVGSLICVTTQHAAILLSARPQPLGCRPKHLQIKPFYISLDIRFGAAAGW